MPSTFSWPTLRSWKPERPAAKTASPLSKTASASQRASSWLVVAVVAMLAATGYLLVRTSLRADRILAAQLQAGRQAADERAAAAAERAAASAERQQAAAERAAAAAAAAQRPKVDEALASIARLDRVVREAERQLAAERARPVPPPGPAGAPGAGAGPGPGPSPDRPECVGALGALRSIVGVC